MPDFDYEQYERRQAEWEKENAANAAAAKIEESSDKTETSSSDETDVSEEDVSW